MASADHDFSPGPQITLSWAGPTVEIKLLSAIEALIQTAEYQGLTYSGRQRVLDFVISRSRELQNTKSLPIL